ncbi:endo-alpha-N-acetylgalactosaminidase family protein [Paenibacillus sp. LHD-117]|uniref:endo-alpha-N-acetylgalactosaminidase family protein n=1 Tax=Paenibacillus sp. LHD-117 TaxID=3071412 RepID=UPI0027E1D157|nr:endo-alpha-N-acetylgalactosaminidase family protein [Paenibacillus sp. LHD-117]MDQ6423283.1 endo-alpha-N-acetylgalactosaminidase family protein [Paenibacillus sp. LHD-117]
MKSYYKKWSVGLSLSLSLLLISPSAVVFADGSSEEAAQVVALEEESVYFRDYNDGNISGWSRARGTTTFAADNGAVKATTTGAVIVYDNDSPAYTNGEYEVKLKFNAAPSRFGLVLRYADSNNYSVIHYDVSNWGWGLMKNGQESWGDIANSSYTFEANRVYAFKLRYEENQISMWIDGQPLFSESVPSLPLNAGKIGLRSWFANKVIHIDDVKLTELKIDRPEEKPIEVTDTLQSDDMSVVIDKEFPRVQKYTWKDTGAEMLGQLNGVNEIKINGKSYFPTATQYVKTAASGNRGERASYTLQFPSIQVALDVELEAMGNALNFNVTRIAENGSEKVKSIEFPNHDLISVVSTQTVAKETGVSIPGGWNTITEEYNDLKAGAANASGGRTYAFLNNDKLAGTIVNNIVNGFDKSRLRIADNASGNKQASVWNGAFIYRGSDVLEAQPLPSSKVIITPDANGDGTVDWQDGAIAYRDYAPEPYRSEMIRDNISYISMNIGSTTTSPFLRAFDNAKNIHNLTDGFGQIILFKGYQAEGHDDSHPDYGGHIGIRQGGKEDFNFVLSEGEKYNIKGGVHINATEYMLDAYETKMENLTQPLAKGWGWLDQAYYVNQTKDLESGELKRRLDMLKDDTGDNLDFVYVDVYSGNGYNASKLAEYINGNGWMLGTEFAGPLYEQAAWVHWGTDPGYPNQGNNSQVVRFLRNEVLDGFMTTPLLKGNKQVGVGYWQPNPAFYSYNETTKAFFNHNLPTKYMQYFPIMKMTNDRVDFEGGVSVAREADGKIHLRKGGNDIAIMTDSSNIGDSTVFIPWDPVQETKIYHWNPAGGSSTWKLPASWSEVQTAQLYKLTDLGREHVGAVNVVGGEVTLTATIGVGYVLYKGLAEVEEEMVWGDGGHALDPGFDSQSFGAWSKSSTGANTDHIAFAKTGNADDIMQVKGPSDALLKQTMTGLEPGKSYTASVWANIGGKRKMTIGVKQGSEEVSNFMEDSAHTYFAPQHKYYNSNYQRVKVTFTAQAETAELYLAVAAGSGTVNLDDVRVWENPTHTDPGDSVLYEDFENVDEGWGPFVYSKNGAVRTHLAEKKEGQIMTYVLDGKYSLKSNEDATGEWLRTLPQTLRLETDHNYRLTMKVKTDTEGMYTVALRTNENGTVRDLASKTLALGESEIDLPFQTNGAQNAYLAIIKNLNNNQAELTGTLVLDNVRVDDEGPIEPEEGVLVSSLRMLETNVVLSLEGSKSLSTIVEPANAFNKMLSWSSDQPNIVSVDQNGKITALASGSATITATTTDGSNLTATSKVTVYEANVLIPQSGMTATATSVQPGAEGTKALDGDPSTAWHTAWSPPHLPESITIDLGGSYPINELKYLPRSDAGNGTITKYNLYVSTDGETFTLAATGNWARSNTEKSVIIPKTTASYVKLEAVEAVGNFASAAEINVYRVPSVSEEPSTSLTGADTTQSEEEFTVNLGLKHLENEVYAGDIEVTYDSAVLTFVKAASLLEGVGLLEAKDNGSGKVRLIFASKGAANAIKADAELIALTFKSKELEETVETTVSIAGATLAGGEGTESQAAASSHAIEVQAEEPGLLGDINVDGKVSIGDLAMVAAHYGKDSTHPDWNAIKRVDVDKDGKIDLDDLVLIANKIIP